MHFILNLEGSNYAMRKILKLCAEFKEKGIIKSYTPSPESQTTDENLNIYELTIVLPPNSINTKKTLEEQSFMKKIKRIIEKNKGWLTKIENQSHKYPVIEPGTAYIMILFTSSRQAEEEINILYQKTQKPKIIYYQLIRKEPLETL